MIGGRQLGLALLALACSCAEKDVTLLSGEGRDGPPVKIGDTRLDSNPPGGTKPPGEGTPPNGGPPATAEESCSDPMHGSRYSVCARAAEQTQPTVGLSVKSTLGSDYEEMKGLKYRVKGWNLHAIH
jgi:hypothetical protein